MNTPPSVPREDAIARATAALNPRAWVREPRLLEALSLLERNQPARALEITREFVRQHGENVHALYLLAQASIRMGQLAEAEQAFARATNLSPDFAAGRFGFANLLLEAGKVSEAREQSDALLALDSQNPLFVRLKALVLEAGEDFESATEIWRALIDEFPSRPDCWLRYGHALRALGRQDDCIAAYRKSAKLVPSFGSAWWALGDMKTYRFEESEIVNMERQLARTDLGVLDRIQIHFALGKAHADARRFEKSFANYAQGNAIHRRSHPHNSAALTSYVARAKKLYAREFLRAREGLGKKVRGPIFLVGMTRSGSTLVEQILASHPDIEATRELANLSALPFAIQSEFSSRVQLYYPEVLANLDASSLHRFGEKYLEGARSHRKSGRPFFVDKMGANFMHVGLIRLLLPDAVIIDVRRHPLACGFSMYAQLFPQGQNESYDLGDIGRSYRDYVDLMAHFERIEPGRMHRIHYEKLVGNPEAEIRRLLSYIGVPFDPACLDFHAAKRTVTTASSEQVRSPLYRTALEGWRPYERWLDPLKTALGSVLDSYPDVPAEFLQAGSGIAPI